MDMVERVALVTGGSSGIGRATAVKYAKLGYKVAVTGRCQEKLDSTLQELVISAQDVKKDSSLSNFLCLRADFEDPAQVERVVLDTLATFKRLDILINNAGYPGKRLGVTDPDFFEDFQNILQVNLVAATRIAQLAIPELLKTKGVIVNVSSIADTIPLPTVSYSVAKAGLSMLTKTLANALDGKQVRVVTVSPGPIKTNFAPHTGSYAQLTSLRRAGESEEVAEVIVFLTSEKASYIHGCTIEIDGGTKAKYGDFYGRIKELRAASASAPTDEST